MKHVLLLAVSLAVVSAQQCSSGLTTLFLNNQVTSCNPQNEGYCSKQRPGYFCQLSATGSTFICCGAAGNQCGSNSPQISENGQIKTCSSVSDCNSAFLCTNGVCCPDSSTGTIGVGGSCSGSYQCRGSASCFNNFCTCPTGTTNVNGQCTGGGSGGICGPNQVWVNNECYNTVPTGERCQFSQQCVGGGSCVGGVCSTGGGCQSNQVLINNQCFPMSQIGGNCQYPQQCPTNSQCYNSFCVCNSGYQNVNGFCSNTGGSSCAIGTVSVNSQCLSLASPGFSCLSTLQCLENSQCLNGVCVCQNGKTRLNGYCITVSNQCPQAQTYYNGQCYSYAVPNQGCVVTSQCVGGASCYNNMCSCPSGTRAMYGYCVTEPQTNQCGANQVYISGQCYNTVSPGGYCTYPQQCLNGATCTNNICTANGGNNCGGNQVQINGQCYNTVPIGGYCQFTQQCLNNGMCSNSYCVANPCGTNQVLVNGQCMPTVQLGGYCQYPQQCVNGGTCSNNICTSSPGNSCLNNQIMINGYCYPTVQIGGYCQYTQQCVGGTCSGGICTSNGGSSCPINQVLVNNQCIPTVTIGGYCQYTQQCTGGSTCQLNICTCPNGQSASNGNCNGNGNGGNCKNYQVIQNNICYDTVSVGQQCQINAQCIAGSSCSASTCVCNSGTVYNGTTCITSFSSCGAGLVSYGNTCQALRALNQVCSMTLQCMGFGVCSGGKCVCPTSFTAINGVCRSQDGGSSSCGINQVLIGTTCYYTANIGQQCQYVQQCLNGATCSNGYCICPSGTTTNGNSCTGGNNNGGSLTCSKLGYYVPLQNGQPINCLYNYCPSNSVCEYNYSVQYYVCCTATSSGK